MIVSIASSTIIGIDSYPVDVEVDISRGLPQFSTVGLPDTTVRESKDRIKSAIKNSGYPFPRNKVTVNLAPADIKKEGTCFDLPIAVGILAAENIIVQNNLGNYLLMGELSLDGKIKEVQGILSAAIMAQKKGFQGIIVPKGNAEEAAMVRDIDVIAALFLSDVVEFLNSNKEILPIKVDIDSLFSRSIKFSVDFSDVNGQEQAKRALEIAAAGGHNVLMSGPPGSGKTMLAKRFLTILPDPSFEEIIETTKICSSAGLIKKDQGLILNRPFRSPHHSISDAGLVGGGQIPKPGEISLAHNGVLFLDELPEFRRNVLEVLRQPLESGNVTIARSALSVTYPARFILIAAMNPCPCGYLTDPHRECRCSPRQISYYRSKISGPLLDRIDIHVEIPSVRYKDLTQRSEGDSSATIKERVNRVREIQQGRFQNSLLYNARMTNKQIKAYCNINDESHKLLEMAMVKLGLSARAFTKILKIARTIADLENEQNIQTHHISEAIQYRILDRQIL